MVLQTWWKWSKIIKVLIKKNRKAVIHSMLTLSCSSSTLNAFLADLKKKKKTTHFSLTLDYQVLFIFDLNIHHSPCLLNIHLFFFVPLIHISVAIEIKEKTKTNKTTNNKKLLFFSSLAKFLFLLYPPKHAQRRME